MHNFRKIMTANTVDVADPLFFNSTAAEQFKCPVCLCYIHDAVRCTNRHMFCRRCVDSCKEAADLARLSPGEFYDDGEEIVDDGRLSVYVKFPAATTAAAAAADNDQPESSGDVTAAETARPPPVWRVDETTLNEWKSMNNSVSFKQHIEQTTKQRHLELGWETETHHDLEQLTVFMPSALIREVLRVSVATIGHWFDRVAARSADVLSESATIAEWSSSIADRQRAADSAGRVSEWTSTMCDTLTRLDGVADDIRLMTLSVESEFVYGSMTRLHNDFIELLAKASYAQWFVVGRRGSTVATVSDSDRQVDEAASSGNLRREHDDDGVVVGSDGLTSGDEHDETYEIVTRIKERVLAFYEDVKDRELEIRLLGVSSCSGCIESDAEMGGELIDARLVQLAIEDILGELEPPLLERSEFDATVQLMGRRAVTAATALKTTLQQTRDAVDAVDEAAREIRDTIDGYLATNDAAFTSAVEKTRETNGIKARKIRDASVALSEQVRSAEKVVLEVDESITELCDGVEKEATLAVPIFVTEEEDDEEERNMNASVVYTCPVCRQPTDFEPCSDADSALSELPVSCPFVDVMVGNCCWTGRYVDYGDHTHQYDQHPQPAAATVEFQTVDGPAASPADLELDPSDCVREAMKRRYEDSEDDELDQSPDTKIRKQPYEQFEQF